MGNQRLYTAVAIAQERLENYIAEKLGSPADDLEAWLFYTNLLAKAQKYQLDHSGFESSEYRADRAVAVENCKRDHPERF